MPRWRSGRPLSKSELGGGKSAVARRHARGANAILPDERVWQADPKLTYARRIVTFL